MAVLCGWNTVASGREVGKITFCNNAGFGGNANALLSLGGGRSALDMTNGSLEAKDSLNGHVTAAAIAADGQSVSYLREYTDVTTLWRAFPSAGGLPPHCRAASSRARCAFSWRQFPTSSDTSIAWP